MPHVRARVTLFGLVLGAAGVIAVSARADGLPVVGVDAGPEGVAASAGDVRYVTVPARRNTVVAAIQTDGGRLLRSAVLEGRFAVPVVAFDGSASGLSADGTTLVLVRPRVSFPRAQTAFAVLDAARLRLRGVVTLAGDFSFDALSPDGASLYLVEYVSPRDPTRYRVRVYDLRARRLVPEPVVDPRASGETMRGYPITRATSPDGRWAYTLYDGAGKHPFVHALDTRSRQAVCIDLHALAGRRDLSRLRLSVSSDGGTLHVVHGGRSLAVIDTDTHRLGEPRRAGRGQATQAASANDAGRSVWRAIVPAGGAAVLLTAAAFMLAVRRKRRDRAAVRVNGSSTFGPRPLSRGQPVPDMRGTRTAA